MEIVDIFQEDVIMTNISRLELFLNYDIMIACLGKNPLSNQFIENRKKNKPMPWKSDIYLTVTEQETELALNAKTDDMRSFWFRREFKDLEKQAPSQLLSNYTGIYNEVDIGFLIIIFGFFKFICAYNFVQN